MLAFLTVDDERLPGMCGPFTGLWGGGGSPGAETRRNLIA
jgi:hypothetical protein